MMNNSISIFMFATAMGFLTFSCNQTNSSSLSETSETTQDIQSEALSPNQATDLEWLNDANPSVDAYLAIQNQDYTLLAFAGRATSFPGMNSDSSTLQQQCGYRLLPNSGDALRSESGLILRKKLYQYAATYNQLSAAACQKNN
jgi:hypothetical protein